MIAQKNVPKISIVMSAYNAADYLEEAIDSILKQTFIDFEFIIIDDGSSDATPQIISRYAKRDARIKVITQKKNQGLITALNSGFKLARGKYIARMDADDISLPERLRKEYEYMETHPEIVILGTQAAFIDAESNVYAAEPFLLHDREIRLEIMFRNQQFRHGAVLLRRSIVSENKELYDPKAIHFEDFEYWPRILKYGKGANLSEVLYLYRRIPTSLTATKKSEMSEGTEFVMKRERALTVLPSFSINAILTAFRTATTYKPKYIVIKNKTLSSNLKWCYQSYLFGLSRLYAQRGKYMSAVFIMTISFSLNPFSYVYTVVMRIIRSV